MVRLIVGEKGEGKTKIIQNMVNKAVSEANGSIVYLDRNSKHMYELNNKIRLIDVSYYPIGNSDQFVGFICGIISQDHDIEEMYLDGFLDCAKATASEAGEAVKLIDKISGQFGITFTISLSVSRDEIPDDLKDKIIN